MSQLTIVAQSSPPFHVTDPIELVSTENSKITAVSVHSDHAEVTRVFKFDVKAGQNHVIIKGLPDLLDQDSLRVKGQGSVTIHDITVSSMNHPAQPTPSMDYIAHPVSSVNQIPPPIPSMYYPVYPPCINYPALPRTSPAISDLRDKKEKIIMALERYRKSTDSLEAYLATMNVKIINMTQVRQVLDDYNGTAEEFDNRVLQLEAQLREIEEELNKEYANLWGQRTKEYLNKRATISIFTDVVGEVEIVLTYAVHGAFWTAGYDICVNTNSCEEPVTLIYKAAITQRTGEDWSDIPLILETATPTFVLDLPAPALDPWNLSIRRPGRFPSTQRWSNYPTGFIPYGTLPQPQEKNLDEDWGYTKSRVAHRTFDVVSKSNVSAMFQTSGFITVPSDGIAHNMTIVELKLPATMSWVCVPKKDSKAHLSAKIKNASQYTLLRGIGRVYVDGSFISRSEVPAVSPEESFDYNLGLDPSIRITYHPITKIQSDGKYYNNFFTKTSTRVFTQTITVHNTKSTRIEGMRIAEQIPVSEDAQIKVKLINPSLVSKAKGKVAVAKGVSAMWEGASEPEPDVKVLGRNGKFWWDVTLQGQEKVNLVLQYKVIAPAKKNVVGLA